MQNDAQRIENLLVDLQEHAAQQDTSILVEASIAITAERLRLVDIRRIAPLAVIRY